MGHKVIILYLCTFVMFSTACKKDKDDGYPKFLLSENAKGWFSNVQNGNLIFNSSTKLSEGYKVEIKRYTELGTFNGKQGLGEVCRLTMDANLMIQSFYFELSNVDNPEHLEVGYFWPPTIWVESWYLLDKPYKELRYMSNAGGSGRGMINIGDTTINNKKYKDIFIQYSNVDPILEIYLSKSNGLLGFKTTDLVVWYKSE